MKNLEMLKFCEKYNITQNQYLGVDEISGSLFLSSIISLPDNFIPTVGGSLYLGGLTSLPENFNPIVGGSLDLSSLTSIPNNFNPIVGGSLDLSSLTSIPNNFNPIVGGWLDLSSITSLPENFNPTVGDSLYFTSLTSLPNNFNPTVGDSLYLTSLTSLPNNFNPTVGGYVYYNDYNEKFIGANVDGLLSWQNGKYIKVDGIFTEVLSKKGNIFKVKKLNNDKEFYLVTDGNNKWSHGDTLKEAKADLIFKISNRDKSYYKDLTLESELSFEECIEMYRVITGACSLGTKDFVQNKLKLKKKSYKIQEVIELTKGEYNSTELVKYFVK